MLHFILIFVLVACGQTIASKETETDKSTYSLSITTYNHAERFMHGTTTYSLSGNTLTIQKRFLNEDKVKVLYSKQQDAGSIDRIRNVQLDTLEDFYFNYCIMPTSGNEYFITITKDSVTKKISLHHYYHATIEQLFIEVNKVIPKKWKLNYLPKDIEQDCEI